MSAPTVDPGLDEAPDPGIEPDFDATNGPLADLALGDRDPDPEIAARQDSAVRLADRGDFEGADAEARRALDMQTRADLEDEERE